MAIKKYTSSIVAPIQDPDFLGGVRYDVTIVRFNRDGDVETSYDISTWSLRSVFYRLRTKHPGCLRGDTLAVFAPSPSGLGSVCIWSCSFP